MRTYDYQYVNEYIGRRSTTGTVEADRMTGYFMRSLYQRAISKFTFDIPIDWDYDYFTSVLFGEGFIAVIPTDMYGVIPQICTLSGYGLYRQPVNVLVTQPMVEFKGVIGESCELIKLTPDYRGIWDIVEHYAIQLSTACTSLKMSLINSRLAYILAAKNKAAAETLKAIAEKLSAGESTIIIDKLLKDDLTNDEPIYNEAYDPAKTYITDKILADMTTILNKFDREIGIPVVDQKKERMITDEVQAIQSDAFGRIKTWSTCLDRSIEKVNDMFGLNISYKLNGGDEYGNSKDNADRVL